MMDGKTSNMFLNIDVNIIIYVLIYFCLVGLVTSLLIENNYSLPIIILNFDPLPCCATTTRTSSYRYTPHVLFLRYCLNDTVLDSIIRHQASEQQQAASKQQTRSKQIIIFITTQKTHNSNQQRAADSFIEHTTHLLQ